MTILFKVISITLALSSICFAADEDDFDDLDFDFSIRQKSTISDFPMQEIGQEELSNAAIAGALQTYDAEKSDKPIYEEQDDKNEKRKKIELTKNDEKPDIDDYLKFKHNQTSIPQFQQPTYNTPNGRSYNGHNTATVERY